MSSPPAHHPTIPPARHPGGQPSPADLVGQAVRLRGLPQASPQVCKGVAYCSKDCQVCVASHPAGLLPKRQASMIRPHAQDESIHALHAKARARMQMLAQGCESSRLLLTDFAYVACVRCLSLRHTRCSLTPRIKSSERQTPEA